MMLMIGLSFLRTLLYGAAKEKLRAGAVKAAQAHVQGKTEPSGDESPAPGRRCLLGVVFALEAESGGLEDLLEERVTTRAAGLVVHEGFLHERQVVLIVSGPGGKNAARAAAALIAGHRPRWVVSAGFAGGLSAELSRYDVVLATEVVEPSGAELAVGGESGIDLPALAQPQAVHLGRVLSVDRLVRLPQQKRALAEQHHATAVDMESFAVVEACGRQGMPALVARIITDTADEALPAEVETLLRQPSKAGRWGAALGAVWRRPKSAKDLMRLKENALVASDRLARFLAGLVEHLPPLPPPVDPPVDSSS